MEWLPIGRLANYVLNTGSVYDPDGESLVGGETLLRSTCPSRFHWEGSSHGENREALLGKRNKACFPLLLLEPREPGAS